MSAGPAAAPGRAARRRRRGRRPQAGRRTDLPRRRHGLGHDAPAPDARQPRAPRDPARDRVHARLRRAPLHPLQVVRAPLGHGAWAGRAGSSTSSSGASTTRSSGATRSSTASGAGARRRRCTRGTSTRSCACSATPSSSASSATPAGASARTSAAGTSRPRSPSRTTSATRASSSGRRSAIPTGSCSCATRSSCWTPSRSCARCWTGSASRGRTPCCATTTCRRRGAAPPGPRAARWSTTPSTPAGSRAGPGRSAAAGDGASRSDLSRLGGFLGYTMDDPTALEPLTANGSPLIAAADLDARIERFADLDLRRPGEPALAERPYDPRRVELVPVRQPGMGAPPRRRRRARPPAARARGGPGGAATPARRRLTPPAVSRAGRPAPGRGARAWRPRARRRPRRS